MWINECPGFFSSNRTIQNVSIRLWFVFNGNDCYSFKQTERERWTYWRWENNEKRGKFLHMDQERRETKQMPEVISTELKYVVLFHAQLGCSGRLRRGKLFMYVKWCRPTADTPPRSADPAKSQRVLGFHTFRAKSSLCLSNEQWADAHIPCC